MTFQNQNFDKPLSAVENNKEGSREQLISEMIDALNRRIDTLRSEIDAYSVANLNNAREELEGLKEEKKRLKQELASQTTSPENTETIE